MINIYRIELERREDGYTLKHDVIHFCEENRHDQCDSHGSIKQDPLYTLDLTQQMITALTNPEELGLSEHQEYPVISNVNMFKMTWTLAATQPQILYTPLPLAIFTDLFHREQLLL